MPDSTAMHENLELPLPRVGWWQRRTKYPPRAKDAGIDREEARVDWDGTSLRTDATYNDRWRD